VSCQSRLLGGTTLTISGRQADISWLHLS